MNFFRLSFRTKTETMINQTTPGLQMLAYSWGDVSVGSMFAGEAQKCIRINNKPTLYFQSQDLVANLSTGDVP